MLNFYVEEVAEALHQAAELANRGDSITMTAKRLRELANKLTGGLPRARLTDHDWAYRYPRLEPVILTNTKGQQNIFWFKPKTIDHATWTTLYDMGWRPARFGMPMVIAQPPREPVGD